MLVLVNSGGGWMSWYRGLGNSRYTEKGNDLEVPKHPRGWGNDELSRFLEMAHVNTYATFQNMAPCYEKLSKINDLLGTAIDSTAKTGKLLSSILLLRAHASYLAAVRLGLATQACESFMAQRGSLEAALYSEFIANNQEAGVRWLNRNDSPSKNLRGGDGHLIFPSGFWSKPDGV